MRHKHLLRRNLTAAFLTTIFSSSDLPEDEVRIKLDEVNSKISQAKQANPDSLTAKGAEIWLVPTYKPIEEWQPIAKREVPYGVQWEWQT